MKKEMQRTRFVGKNEHKVFEIAEGMTGAELKSWARKHKIPLLKSKMKRTKFPKRIVTEKKEKKLHLISQYLKDNPEMKRTKFNHNE
jgi:hypothetical protein